MAINKLKSIILQQQDGNYSSPLIISPDAKNVYLDNNQNLQETIGNYNLQTDGGSIKSNLNIIKQNILDLNTNKAGKNEVGKPPKVASSSDEMVDTEAIYVYTGTTTGEWINGNWYSYSDGQWRSGGSYVGNPINIDATLTQQGAAADAKATGEIIKISTTQPTEANNRIWIDTSEEEEYEIPTMSELNQLMANFIKSSNINITAENYTTIITNVNSQPVNTIYAYAAGLQSSITNLPSNNALNILHYTYKYSVNTNVGQVMIATERSGENPTMFFRTTGSSPVSWSNWVKLCNEYDLDNRIESSEEKIDKLRNDFDDEFESIDEFLNGEITLNFILNSNIDTTTGAIVSMEGFSVSDKILYTNWGGTVDYYSIPEVGDEAGSNCIVAFYDENDTLLAFKKGVNANQIFNRYNADNKEWISNLSYARFSFKTDYLGYAKRYSTSNPEIYYEASETRSGGIKNDINILESYNEEIIKPEWFSGGYRESGIVYFPNNNSIIRTDYISVAIGLNVIPDTGYQVRVSYHKIDGELISKSEWKSETISVTNQDADYIRLELQTNPATAIDYDPNTIGLHVKIIRKGKVSIFNTEISATPNDPNIDINQKLPKYLALIACREIYEAGKIIVTTGYLYRTVVAPYKLYYSSGKPDNVRFLCDWNMELASSNVSASRATPNYYSFAITDAGDIICVYRGEIVNTYPRANPIVYPHNDLQNPIIVQLDTKPTSWLSNCGVFVEEGSIWFGEYIRDWHTNAYVWQVNAPYTNPSDWSIVKSYERDTDVSDPSTMVLGKIEHIHHVARDPFSGVIYVTTGDHHTEARIDYFNNGTWNVLKEGDETVCRQLNFVFTPTYIYWASDAAQYYDPVTSSYVDGAHKFFRAKRTSEGLLDIEHVESYSLCDLHSKTVTYHVCYISDPECILILDRHENLASYCEIPFKVWDIKNECVSIAGTFKQDIANNGGLILGFRSECCQHYPNYYNDEIAVGFSLYPNTIKACGNPIPNIQGSSSGMVSDDTKNVSQVNSLILHVTKK